MALLAEAALVLGRILVTEFLLSVQEVLQLVEELLPFLVYILVMFSLNLNVILRLFLSII